MLHPSVHEAYRDIAILIQIQLSAMQCRYAVTQSIIEIWKFVYFQFPNLIWAQVPEYPHYLRELLLPLPLNFFAIDWELVDDREDMFNLYDNRF